MLVGVHYMDGSLGALETLSVVRSERRNLHQQTKTGGVRLLVGVRGAVRHDGGGQVDDPQPGQSVGLSRLHSLM